MIQDKDDMERGWKEFCFWRLTVQTFPLDESGLSIWLIRGAPYVDTLFMIGVDIIRLGVRFEVRK